MDFKKIKKLYFGTLFTYIWGIFLEKRTLSVKTSQTIIYKTKLVMYITLFEQRKKLFKKFSHLSTEQLYGNLENIISLFKHNDSSHLQYVRTEYFLIFASLHIFPQQLTSVLYWHRIVGKKYHSVLPLGRKIRSFPSSFSSHFT